MSLANALYALLELAEGRAPDPGIVSVGLYSLDVYLLHANADQLVKEASATLELYLVTGMVSLFADARARIAAMAAAVQRLMPSA